MLCPQDACRRTAPIHSSLTVRLVSVQTALGAGADVVVQSSHKTLSALTQAAMLHVRGAAVDRSRISRALQMLQVSTIFTLKFASFTV